MNLARKLWLYKYGLIVTTWCALVAASLVYNLDSQSRHTLEAVGAAATANISKDIGFRKWATSHGGVYVPPGERTPPNPYLQVPERDVVTSSGQLLTLMNPAYMLRDLQAHFGDDYGTRSNITSLKPLNPDNIADPWETLALQSFEQGETSYQAIEDIEGEPYLRLMKPFIVEAACLKCHGQQGYQVGEIRGAIGTAVPMKPFLAREDLRATEMKVSHGVIWLIGLIGLGVIGRREHTLESARIGMEHALRDSEEHFRSTFEQAAVGIAHVAPDGRWLKVNQRLCKILGYPREALLHTRMHELFLAHDGACGRSPLQDLLAGKDSDRSWEQSFTHADGRSVWVNLTVALLRNVDGSPRLFIVVVEDIGVRKALESELRLAAVAFESQEGIFITDADSVIVQVNEAFSQITGYAAAEAIGHTPKLLSSGRHDAAFYRTMQTSIRETGSWQGEIWNRRKNGEIFPEWLTITAVNDEHGVLTHYVCALIDITHRKAAEDEIRTLAFFDPLTRLPNRRLLFDRLQQALATTKRNRTWGALLFIDLDNFKTLNDTRGHSSGDALLRQVAERLRSCVREGDSIARQGGDEFVVVLEDLGATVEGAINYARVVGNKILAALAERYDIRNDHDSSPFFYQGTASIGVAMFGGAGRDSIEELLKRADMAMYKAKDAGRNAVYFFDPEMQAAVTARAALENDLRTAVHERAFVLYYQRQVDSAGRTTGAEALIRWQHPQRGLVGPIEFIPLAEETGMIHAIGKWVLQAACSLLATWGKRPEAAHLTLSVNISARQFHHPEFVQQVLEVLEETGANPQRLKLELTESLLVLDIEGVIAKMNALKTHGIGFSLDDFGTGYSSLAYLKRLPLDQLKIDQSFVRDILIDPNDEVIAAAVVSLAASLGLAVIAEGVETEAQRSALAALGCLAYQGYLFSRPIPLEEFEAQMGVTA